MTVKQIGTREIRSIARRYWATFLAVFGSFARATATESSEVDVLVDLMTPGAIGNQLRAAFIVSRAVVRRMKERGHGKIINICSLQSELGRATIAPYAASKDDPEFDRWICGRTPAGRWGNPDELVGALLFFASPASDFVNGQLLFVDGGITAAI